MKELDNLTATTTQRAEVTNSNMVTENFTGQSTNLVTNRNIRKTNFSKADPELYLSRSYGKLRIALRVYVVIRFKPGQCRELFYLKPSQRLVLYFDSPGRNCQGHTCV